ncbi:MAG: nucleoside triphosphate pyrophosphohydrolase [Deltaproteobacteria bacterium RBG_13_61_14]|nr:MAG: nucleoside triphosphate pyrophosphohydrolase [Deltaproteobacteria bacterium RBG_13_61_14]
MKKKAPGKTFEQLVEVIRRLRAPDGCPWDRAQSPETLKPYVIEEAYEVVEAIEQKDPAAVCEELGDLLLQIVLQAQIYSETNAFTIADVIEAITAKMLERHPHVFGDAKADTPEEVRQNWVRIKQETKGEKSSALGDVPRSLPALLRARRLTENAAQVGFDWSRTEEVVEKVKEEWRELEKATASGDQKKIVHEFGDLLFALVNLARFLKINPDEALRQTLDRFTARFRFIEASAQAAGKSLEEMSLDEMESYWQEAKKRGL